MTLGVQTTEAADPPTGTGRLESIALGPFELDNGTTLPALIVAYRHDGPGPGVAPQILVIHALTGSADAAGDWWEPLIGPGRALDTDRFGVLSANLLGGRYGTTGPTSVDPRDGPAVWRQPSRRSRRATRRAPSGGFSMRSASSASSSSSVARSAGWSRSRSRSSVPEAVGTVMPIAAPAATGPMAVAWNHLQVQLIDRLGLDGLALARALAMTTYRSEADFDERFGRDTEPDGRPSIVSYLDHQGRKLIDRFDPATYRVLAGAMDRHDVSVGRGGLAEALAPLAASGTRLIGVGIEDDILYGPRQVRQLVDAARAAGVDADYREIRSTKGHDAFLVEWDQLSRLLRVALTDL